MAGIRRCLAGTLMTAVAFVISHCVGTVALAGTVGRGDPRPALIVRGSGGVRLADMMSYGDSRPNMRDVLVGEGEVGYFIGDSWDVGLSGYYGESVFDFETAWSVGRLRDAAWGVRVGADRWARVSDRLRLFLGAGMEYAETDSRPEVDGLRSEGLRNYLAGGWVRAGVASMATRRATVVIDCLVGGLRGQAVQRGVGSRYDWAGPMVLVRVGVGYVLLERGGGACGR
jgi:hypothetical protein